MGDFLYNSLPTDWSPYLNFLPGLAPYTNFIGHMHVYTDHSMPLTYIVKAFLRLRKVFNRLRLSRSYGIRTEFSRIFASCYVNIYWSFGLT